MFITISLRYPATCQHTKSDTSRGTSTMPGLIPLHTWRRYSAGDIYLTTAHPHYRSQKVKKFLSTAQDHFLLMLHQYHSAATSSTFARSHPSMLNELKKLLQPNKASSVTLLVGFSGQQPYGIPYQEQERHPRIGFVLQMRTRYYRLTESLDIHSEDVDDHVSRPVS